MKLSADQLTKIMKAARQGPVAHHDKRRAARTHMQARIRIVPLPNGHRGSAIPVCMRDLSCRGVGLVTDVAIEEGCQFILEFSGSEAERGSILCTVVHCHELSQSSF